MKHECHDVYPRPHGPMAIGVTTVEVQGNELVIRVNPGKPIVPAKYPSGIAMVDVRYDDELWN